MSVVVLGDTQAVAAAAYVSAQSGRRVDLVRSDAPAIQRVELSGQLRDAQVVPHLDLPDGPIEAVIVVTRSRSLYELLKPLALRLAGLPLLLAPGGFAGALRVDAWFKSWGLPAPLVGEVTGFPVGGEAHVDHFAIRSVKHLLPVAGLDADTTAEVHRVFVALLPELVSSEMTTTSLSNTNHMIHPGVVVANAARVDNGEPFTFYRSGISPAVGRLLERVDRERMGLVESLGGRSRSVRDWMVDFYAPEGMAGKDIIECLGTFVPFADVAGPTHLDYRYLVDDVPHGLAQWAGLARSMDLPVPYMDALLLVLGAMAPDLDLGGDQQAAHLFRQFLTTHQGVPA